MRALLRVFLVPTGEVVTVVVEESSGNDAFVRSALLAVSKIDRFQVPGQSRQKGPHRHMDDQEKREQLIRLLIFDTVVQHGLEIIFCALVGQRVPGSL